MKLRALLIALALFWLLCVPTAHAQPVMTSTGNQVLIQPGAAITPYTVVVSVGGLAYPADPTNSAHNGKVLGIAVSQGVVGSGPVVVLTSGQLSAAPATFVQDSVYYVGLNGVLSTTQPVTGVWQAFMGFAQTTNTFYVAAQPTLYSAAATGTVTNFTAGALLPLFTTSVATATTTPALTFSLSTAGAHAFLGNNTGSTATPAYVQPAFTDLSGSVAATQMPALTGDITTSAGTVATTLATVNASPGTFKLASVTVNAKGLVTAASSGSAAPATFISSPQALSTGNVYGPFTHGLGAAPTQLWYQLVCTTADAGYSPGDTLTMFPCGASATSTGVDMWATSTTVSAVTGTEVVAQVLNKGTGADTNITAADWTLTFYARL